jgi:hypothetical protein
MEMHLESGISESKRRATMLITSKWLLIIAGGLLILDSILIFAGIPNPISGWPLPCPVTLLLLGAGIFLFGIGNKTFKKE